MLITETITKQKLICNGCGCEINECDNGFAWPQSEIRISNVPGFDLCDSCARKVLSALKKYENRQ